MKNLFNVYTEGKHKVFVILGIRFKVNTKKNFLFTSSNNAIKDNRIVFVNFSKGGYGDNPKYIVEELLKQNNNYEIIWLVKNPYKEKKNFPKGVKLVNYSSKKALKVLSTAKIWVSNTRLNYYIKKGLQKKDEQVYIQTWHGALGLKKIEKDVETNPHYKEYVKLAKKDSLMEDFLVSTSKYDTEILNDCFWYKNKYLEIGYPRNDIFFLDDDKKVNKINQVKKHFNISADAGIILYAPTFRDNNDFSVYNLEISQIQNKLREKFGKNFVTLVRLHPHLKSKSEEIAKKYKNTINATKYPDIQELILASDILITDYSSSIFDFMNTNRLAFIYANDYAEYTKERGFYLDINNLPFPVAYNNEDLLAKIDSFNEYSYKNNLEKFKQQRHWFDNGTASKKIVELINDIISQKSVETIFNQDIEILKSLKKYLVDARKLNNPSVAKVNLNNKKIIWQMWWQGEENAPDLVKKCLNSVRKYYPENRVVITKNNYKEYVDLPEVIIEKYEKGLINIAHFSDILRVSLLCAYGGVWIDATCLLTAKIPEEILQQEFFYFKSPTWVQNPRVPNINLLSKLVNVPTFLGGIHSGSNWFMVSAPQNYILDCLRLSLVEYWENEDYAIDYFIFHLMLTSLLLNNVEARELYERMLSLSSRNPHLLQISLMDKFSDDRFNEIKKFSFVHKLTHKNLVKYQKEKTNFYNFILNKF